ncbi:amino acid ABC transporter permease [Actinomadura rudentiformis]|uniref:Amino acid ABC transporter permease n=1 Tax=Actinomadura rudentiformis TaxID=359158 RepID=A0A6H9YH66_9ACTN|nr:amino acid ABC transporter permease [Actinomadura rudentiformis]KAB2345635.1 amino acid ABC transporter permease [Actinomadura rudentiformis]
MTTTLDKPAAKPRKAKKSEPSVLFDAPGPRARVRNNIIAVVGTLILLAIAYVIFARLQKEDQFDGKLWDPYLEAETWTEYVFPGLVGTLYAAALGSVLAVLFGVIFGLGRLSDHRWVRIPSGAVVEFFRAIPLLILMFFVFSGPPTIATAFNREFIEITPFMAVVIGLTLYNGSVLAEVFRAGIQSIPKGQSEAAYAIGLRKNGVMRLILVPQATTAMMPAIISQLVVLLKDSALGSIIAYEELLNKGFYQMKANFGNAVPALVITAAIFILINMALGYLATWLERRSRRSRKSAAKTMGTGVGAPPAPGMSVTGQTTGEAGGVGAGGLS